MGDPPGFVRPAAPAGSGICCGCGWKWDGRLGGRSASEAGPQVGGGKEAGREQIGRRARPVPSAVPSAPAPLSSSFPWSPGGAHPPFASHLAFTDHLSGLLPSFLIKVNCAFVFFLIATINGAFHKDFLPYSLLPPTVP